MKKLLIVLLIFLSCGGSNTTQETVENSTTTTTSSLFQPATTIYKFKSLAKYGYTLEEIDGEYCIFFLEFKIQKYFFSIKYFDKFSPIFPLAPVIRIFIGWNLIK